MKNDFSYAVQLTFANCDEVTILNIVNTLYATISLNKFVSIDIINSILPVIPDSFSDDFKLNLYKLVVGITYGYLGKYQEAIEEYDKALKIDPNNVNPLNNKSFPLFQLNNIDEALQCSDKAIHLDSSYANAWYNRACYMVKKGDINEALKNLAEAIRLDNKYIESARTDKDFNLIRNDEV